MKAYLYIRRYSTVWCRIFQAFLVCSIRRCLLVWFPYTHFSNMHGFTIKLNTYTHMRQEASIPLILRPKDKPINHFQEVLTSQSTQKLVHLPSRGGGWWQGTADYCFNRHQTPELSTLLWFAHKQNERAMWYWRLPSEAPKKMKELCDTKDFHLMLQRKSMRLGSLCQRFNR